MKSRFRPSYIPFWLGTLLLVQCKPSAPQSSQQSEAATTLEPITVAGIRGNDPVRVPFHKGMSIYAAINRAGGTSWSDPRKLKLIRGKTETIYDLRKVNNQNNPELQPGDQLIFSER